MRALLLLALLAGPRWPDSYASRVEALALLQTLNAEVLASSSATETLEKWCREHAMANEPRIVAVRVNVPAVAPSDEQLQRLQVVDAAETRHRRVELRCGAHVLSVADNWYVPSRLTPEMNRLLDETDAPFGRVVRPLVPYRRTIAATLVWSPLPAGWERRARPRWSRARGELAIPDDVLVHRAVLYTSAHVPFAEVVERYQNDVLAFSRR